MYLQELEMILETINSTVQEVYGNRLVSVAVFGSVGRRTPRPDSDIDLLIVSEDLPQGRLKRMAEFAQVEEMVEARVANFTQIKPDLSPVIKTREEVLQGSFLFLDLTEDSRILYDRGGFLARYLDELKEKLRRMGAKRIRCGGTWCWVLKEDYRLGEVIEI
uniref:Nucleotidyltransferase domain-containing protein n=1 Tax=Ammonifex degensii TaxID=42838 RepID=A0A7C1F7H2_9THEO